MSLKILFPNFIRILKPIHNINVQHYKECLVLSTITTNKFSNSLRNPKFLPLCHNYSTTTNSSNITASRNKTDTQKSDQKPTLLKEVYYGVLTPQVKAVKFFSLSSSMVGIIGQPFLYNAIVSSGNIPIILAAYSFIGFFTCVTPLLLHLITKRYVTQLLYKQDTDSYVAKTVNFFCVTTQTEFKVDQVTVPELPGMFTTLVAKGKPMFLDPRLFENPDHYARLMGYDKPIDFKLYSERSDHNGPGSQDKK